MILYFSSTGNCEYIAKELAKELSDKAYCINEINEINLKSGEKLGFVFPTYFWRLPKIVTEYMNNLKINSKSHNPYIFFISTYGSTCGQTGRFMKNHLKKKGLSLSAAFGIKTVDDWTVWFDLSDKNVVNEILKEEKMQLEQIINQIKNQEKTLKMKNTLPMIAVMGSDIAYSFARRTKHLNVNDNCIGCGLCEKECPVDAIKLENAKPIWIKKKCTMCLHCLHSCPKFAINYKNKTQNHGQYKHP